MLFINLKYLIIVLVVCFVSAQGQLVSKIKLVDPTKTKGCTPLLLVEFDGSNSLPSGSKSFEWDFGNGDKAKGIDLTKVSSAYTNSGVYKVKLKVSNLNNLAIFSIDSTLITVNQSPKASFVIDGNSSGCAPLSVNFVNTSIVGSGNTLSYRWDFGDGDTSTKVNDIHIYKNKNNYSPLLFIRDNNGCQSTAIMPIGKVIAAGDKPKARFSVQGPALSCSIPLSVNFTNESETIGLAGPFKYFWSYGDGVVSNNPSYTYSNFGNFQVKLKVVDESTNCADSLIKPNLINIVNQTVSFTPSFTTACSPKTLNLVNNLSPVIIGQSLQWNVNNVPTIFGQNNPNYNLTIPGTYDITLQTNGPVQSCNNISAPVRITILPKPTNLSSSADILTSCKATPINFVGNATGNLLTYQWTFSGASPSSSTLKNPTNISYNSPGVYLAKFKVTNSDGCSDSLNNIFLRVSAPIANFSGPSTVCLGSSANFNDLSTAVDGITAWEWDFGDGSVVKLGKNQTYTYQSIGTYSVKLTITTNTGCQATRTIPIRVNEKPDATIGTFTPLNICNNTEVTFINSSIGTADSYRWMVENGIPVNQLTKQNLTYKYINGPATNDVLLFAFKGGCSDTAIIKGGVTVLPPKPDFSFTVPSCTNDSVSFIDKSTNGIIKWSWNFGTTLIKDTSNKANPKFLYSAPGIYNVKLTVTHNNGCSDFKIITVAVPDYTNTLDILPSVTNGCAPLDVKFNTTSSGTSFKWEFGNGVVSSLSNPPITSYKIPGIYAVKLTVVNARGCTLIKTFSTIRVNGPIAKLKTDKASGCTPMAITATDLSIDSVKIVNRNWNFGNGFVQLGNDSLVNYVYPNSQVIQKNGFNLKLTVIDALGCKASDSVKIIPSSPRASFRSIEYKKCDSDSLVFTAFANDSLGVLPFKYLWKFSDSSFAITQSVSKNLKSGNQNISLQVTDANGCTSKVEKNYSIKSLSPQAKFCAFPSGASCTGVLDTIITVCPPLIIDFRNQVIKGKSGIKSYEWDFGDGTSSSLANPSRTYTKVGQYTVRLKVTDSIGCSDTYTFEKLIQFKGPKAIITNNAETCNGAEVIFKAVQLTNTKEKLSYSWNFGNGEANVSGQEVKYRFKTPGPKYINLFYEDTFKTCSINEQDTLVINGIGLVKLRNDTTVCEGELVPIDGEVLGAVYNWSTGAITPKIEVNKEGLYILEIKDTVSGCTNKDSVNILYSSKPVIKGTVVNNNNCGIDQTGKVILSTTIGAPFTYTWTNEYGIDFGNKDSIINITGGLYKVNVLNSLGCEQDTTYLVKNFPSNYDLTLDTIIDIVKCNDKGKLRILAASSLPNEKIRLPLDSIVWVDIFGKRIYSSANHEKNYTPSLTEIRGYDPIKNEADSIYFVIDTLSPGTYSLIIYQQEMVNGLDLIGCPKISGPYTINSPKKPTVILGNDIGTCDTSLVVSSPTTQHAKLLWTSPKELITNQSVIIAKVTGKYSLTAEDSISGCISSDTTVLTFYKTPKVTLGNDIDTCVNVELKLNANTDLGNIFNWYIEGNSTTISTNKELSINSSLVNNTKYLVQVRDSLTGCSNSDTILVNFTNLPQLITSSSTILCQYDTINVKVETLPSTDTFTWMIDSVGVSGRLVNFDVSPKLGKNVYRFSAVDQRGCESRMDSVVINVFNNPNITFEKDTSICLNQTIHLNPKVTDGTGRYFYNWNTSDTLNSFIAKPLTSTYYKLIVRDSLGCSDTDSLKVNVFSLPNLMVSNSDTICKGSLSVLKATASGGFQNFSYSWLQDKILVGNSDSIKVQPTIDTEYLAFVTDSNSCRSDTLKVSVIINNIPKVSLGKDTSVCFGNIAWLRAEGKDGGLVSQTEPFKKYNYDWDSFNDSGFIGSDTNFITINPIQTYKYWVKVSDGRCNSNIDTIQITVDTLPIANASNDLIICKGDSAAISAKGANGGKYMWSANGVSFSTDSIFTIPQIDTNVVLMVVVKDKKGCSAKDSVVISTFQKPIINLPLHICLDSSKALKIESALTNKIPLGKFSWFVNDNELSSSSNPLYDSTINIINAGTYIVKYGIGNCFSQDTTKASLKPKVNGGVDRVICLNDQITQIAKSATNVTYSWESKNGELLGSNDSLTIKISKDSILIAIVQDQFNCVHNDTVSIKAFAQPLLNLNSKLCLDSLLNDTLKAFPVQNKIPNSTFSWYKNNNIIVSNTSDSLLNILDTATYVVRYGTGECFGYDTTGVFFNPKGILIDSQIVCTNDTILLVPLSDTNNNFNWYDLNNQLISKSKDLKITPYSDSIIYVKISNKYQCFNQKTTKIKTYPRPIISLLNIYCLDEGDSVFINVRPINEIPNATYSWSLNKTPLSATISTVDSMRFLSDSGKYQIQYSLGGCVTSAQFKVNFNPVIDIYDSLMVLCNADTLKIGGLSNDANLSYSWKDSFSQLISNDSILIIPADKDSLLLLEVKNLDLCTSKDSIFLKTYAKPSISLPDHLCYAAGTAFELNANPIFSNLPSGEFKWTLNSFPVSNTNNPYSDSILIASDTGTYEIIYGQGRCIDSAQTVITLSPKINLPKDTSICFGNNIQLTGVYSLSTGTGKINYSWQSTASIENLDSLNILAIPDTSLGSYSFYSKVIAQDSLGCVGQDSILVLVKKPVKVNIDTPLACEGDTIGLTANPSINKNQTYMWFNNNMQLSSSKVIQVYKSGIYTLIYEEAGCLDSSKTMITFYEKPKSIGLPLYNFCKDASAIGRLDTGTVVLDAGLASTYLWNTGDSTRTIRVDEQGIYNVKITNLAGCYIIDTIRVNDICPPRVNIPNAFSPNDDLNNDNFDIYTAYVTNFKLWIYNRWGEVIYYTEDKTKPWDGKLNGLSLEAGSYPWLLEYEGLNDPFAKRFKKSGKVTLIK